MFIISEIPSEADAFEFYYRGFGCTVYLFHRSYYVKKGTKVNPLSPSLVNSPRNNLVQSRILHTYAVGANVSDYASNMGEVCCDLEFSLLSELAMFLYGDSVDCSQVHFKKAGNVGTGSNFSKVYQEVIKLISSLSNEERLTLGSMLCDKASADNRGGSHEILHSYWKPTV